MAIDTPFTALAENLQLFVYSVELGSPFPVIIESSKTIGSLKKAILNENPNRLKGFDATELTLYKVELRDDKNLEESVLHAQKEELNVASCVLSEVFPVKPPEETISILLRTSKGRPRISSHWSLRSDTVHHLYEILKRERFVQVRGIPGSGKTTLKTLLQDYILEKNPNASVQLQQSWRNSEGNYKAELARMDPAYPLPRTPTYLLFDEAQDTYNDMYLWNFFFKRVHDKGYNNYYVILFCSYGSPSSQIVKYEKGGTPLDMPPSARVSLWPAKNPIGLLLSEAEFKEVVDKYPQRLELHSGLQQFFYDLTRGHVGAIVTLLELVSNQKRAEMRRGAQLTLDDFHAENPSSSLVQAIKFGIFGCSLPKPEVLSGMPEVTSFLRTLVKDGHVERAEADEQVKYCHQKGWIHSYRKEDATLFTFPSPLHCVYISWILEPSNDMPEYSSLFALCCEAIKRFKPSQMHFPVRRVGERGSIIALPEVQYGDEFYRSFFSATAGNVSITPEFASAPRPVQSRISFFIPGKQWAIEITRDGDRLLEHNARFEESGAYEKWLQSGDMTDYLLLDCRVTVPQERHENIPNLFHVVFGNDFLRS